MSLILDGSLGVTVDAGTAALPAVVSATGTSDTGLWFPAADTVAASTGGTERLRIDSSGNVGIGLTSVVDTAGYGGKVVDIKGPTYLRDTSGGGNYFSAGVAGGVTYLQANGTANSITVYTNGTIRLVIDSSGNVLVTNVAGLGYGTGSGGTVTQATDKSTAVTLNKPTGQITMNGAALASGASVTFSVTCSVITSKDTVILTSPAYGLSYRLECSSVGAGIFYIRVTNVTAGSLSEPLAINYTMIRGATA